MRLLRALGEDLAAVRALPEAAAVAAVPRVLHLFHRAAAPRQRPRQIDGNWCKLLGADGNWYRNVKSERCADRRNKRAQRVSKTLRNECC